MSVGTRSRTGERRREKRAEAEVGLSLSAPETGDLIAASTRNLSGSGAYVVLDEPLPLFSRYRLLLLLPVSGPDATERIEEVEVVAVVVRHDLVEQEAAAPRHCMALYFERISPKDKQTVIEFVDGLCE